MSYKSFDNDEFESSQDLAFAILCELVQEESFITVARAQKKLAEHGVNLSDEIVADLLSDAADEYQE